MSDDNPIWGCCPKKLFPELYPKERCPVCDTKLTKKVSVFDCPDLFCPRFYGNRKPNYRAYRKQKDKK